MTTYLFRVDIEPDDGRWHAWCSALEAEGASTWGATREEALQHIREVLEMVAADMVEEGKELPPEVERRDEPLVAVSV